MSPSIKGFVTRFKTQSGSKGFDEPKASEVLQGILSLAAILGIAFCLFRFLPSFKSIVVRAAEPDTPGRVLNFLFAKTVDGMFLFYFLKAVICLLPSAFIVLILNGLIFAPKETIGCFGFFTLWLGIIVFVLLVLAAVAKWSWGVLFGG